MTDAVAAQIARALSSPEPYWFPGLSKWLTQWWSQTFRADPSGYGTSQFLGGPGCLPRWLQELGTKGERLTRLEVMASAVEARYQAQGLSFLSPKEAASTPKEIFHEALSTDAMPASLLASVIELAKTTHLLRSAGEGMDISHSDPVLPFSVFVSVPAVHERFAVLRLAEGFVHEAMHLQLSLIEQVVPMIRNNELTYFSPWRDGHRAVGGVLHGLYVFVVIHQWLTLQDSSCAYAQRRLPEIRNEVEQLTAFPDADGLTPAGALFARGLVDSVLSASIALIGTLPECEESSQSKKPLRWAYS